VTDRWRRHFPCQDLSQLRPIHCRQLMTVSLDVNIVLELVKCLLQAKRTVRSWKQCGSTSVSTMRSIGRMRAVGHVASVFIHIMILVVHCAPWQPRSDSTDAATVDAEMYETNAALVSLCFDEGGRISAWNSMSIVFCTCLERQLQKVPFIAHHIGVPSFHGAPQ
jgi:hypothetical protein